MLDELLIKEWNYNKNENSPEKYMQYSNKKVWWICSKCGNEWEASISSRSRGSGCPICGKQKSKNVLHQTRLSKSGTLVDKFPYVAEEWNYEKNGSLLPSEVSPYSNKKVWWICKEGHEWQATVGSRSMGRGCPGCSKERGTSFPEQAIFYYLNTSIKAENRYKYEGVELDIFIPELNTGIEYDGYYYHSSKRSRIRDEKKSQFFKEKGIKLIRVVESDEDYIEGNVIKCIYDSSYKYLEKIINHLFEVLGIVNCVDVDIERDRPYILEQYYSYAKANSVAAISPQLLDDWDYEANGKLNPEYISYGSNQKIWWKCNVCGYKWKTTIASRFAGNGCSACSGKVLVIGKNDLLSQNPKLVLEWDYEKNNPLQPNEITVNNGKKVWWTCKICGNSWQASVAHRNNGRICPVCAKEKVIETRLKYKREKEGSLETNFPNVAKEWNYIKNGSLTPKEVTSHSGMKVWWICSTCGTEWEAYISNRVKGHGCPTCFKQMQAERSERTALKRSGSIEDSNPEILGLWNYKRNTDITPKMVTKGSHKKVWWICPVCGFEWQSMVSNIVKGQRCPDCSKHRKRAVLQIDSKGSVVAEYISIAEASRTNGISSSAISKVAKGEMNTAGGFGWRFVD